MKSAILLMLLLPVALAGTDDDGYDLFYQSNREEMNDEPITFDPPLPNWLSGTLVRNGLGLFENGDRSIVHVFDGFAKLSSWRFHGNGSASFSTRFLETDFYKDSISSNSIAPYLMFEGTEPPFSFLQLLEAMQKGMDNMNVNVYRLPGDQGGHDYVVLNDYTKSYVISPRDLSTVESISGSVQGSSSVGFMDMLSTAHLLPEVGTGHHLTFVSSVSLTPFEKSKIKLVRIKSTNVREEVASWDVDRVPYMHSFSVTLTHALVLAQTFYNDMSCMMREARPFKCMQWDGEGNATLYVVELSTGHMTELTMENVFTMHHLNAYNTDDGKMIMDISAYPNPTFIDQLLVKLLRDPVARNNISYHGQIKRFEVDLAARTVKRLALNPVQPAFINAFDMPTMNEEYRSTHYCFMYGVVPKTDNKTINKAAIVKRDMCGKGRDSYWMLPQHYPVEPVFVGRPGAEDEDDGVVLVPMLDGPNRSSYLAVLNSTDLHLLTTAQLPTVVPYNLHGRFFSEIV